MITAPLSRRASTSCSTPLTHSSSSSTAMPPSSHQCFPFTGIGPDAESNPAALRIKYGINPGVSGIHPIPAAESKVGYIPLFWHAAVARPCVFVRAESMPKAATDWASRSSTSRRVSAAHLGWVRAAALPRGRTVPARRPLCRRRPIGARKKRKATVGQLESHQQPRLAAPPLLPKATATGSKLRQPHRTARPASFFARFGREPTGPLPTVIPAHTGGTPLDAIDKGHMEIKKYSAV